MHCKFCSYPETKVVKTDQDDKSNQIYRRRECVKCGERFTTREHFRDNYKRSDFKTSPPIKVLPK